MFRTLTNSTTRLISALLLTACGATVPLGSGDASASGGKSSAAANPRASTDVMGGNLGAGGTNAGTIGGAAAGGNIQNADTGGQTPASGGTNASAGSSSTGGSTRTSAGTTSSNAGGSSTGGAGGGTAGSSSTCCNISSDCNSCLAQQLLTATGKCYAGDTTITGSSLPPCENMQGSNPYTGESNADLCKAVYTCVMNTQCAFSGSSFDSAPCYCGPNNIGLSACAATQNGPCKQQIENGMNLLAPKVADVVTGMGDVAVPTGMAMHILDCEANYCGSQCGITLQGAGTGGASGTGGAAATGGAGTGGTTSRSCAPQPGDTILYHFDDATEANNFKANPNPPLVTSSLAWDSSVDSASDASSGSLKATVTFSQSSQSSEIDGTLPSAIDLTNKTLFACLRLDTDLEADGGADKSLSCTSNVVTLTAVDASSHSEVSPSGNVCPSAIGQWLPYTTNPLVTQFSLDNTGNPNLDSNGNPIVTFNAQQISAIRVTIEDQFAFPPITIPAQTVTYHVDTIGYR